LVIKEEGAELAAPKLGRIDRPTDSIDVDLLEGAGVGIQLGQQLNQLAGGSTFRSHRH
jgi:hypothetical protein